MSLLWRAKLSGRLRLSSVYSKASFLQLNSYSTSKTQKSTSPKSPKWSESSLSSSEGVEKSTGDAISWPKPREIPYQPKVANIVNLIGRVKSRVQFETSSDGKDLAATVIFQERSGAKDSVLIPVVFEGDLAHVVSRHVKENDCVLVSGQLSSEPIHFASIGGLGKLHLVGENLNFVEGYKKDVPRWSSVSDVGDKKPADGATENVDEEELMKFPSGEDWGFSPVSLEGSERSIWGFGDVKHNGENAIKKDGDKSFDLWRDLVKNSLLWWDYRDHKAKGLVKEKFPDFKNKESGDGLWISSAPKWVLQGLVKLEFDVPVAKPKLVQGGENRNGKDEDSWKDLVDNPLKWWDNRTGKRNPKAPDFKHRVTGKGLWISSSPEWALERLPPLK